LIDISVPIRPGMVVYEGDPAVKLERVQTIAKGDLANVSRLELGVHTGTHVDAPCHFLEGAPGSEALSLDALVGPAVVIDAASLEANLDEAALRGLAVPEGAERLLFRTRNSELWKLPAFSKDFVGLTESGARYLVQRGARLVGLDYLSVAPAADPAPAHVALLSAGVVVLEGLDLEGVEPGEYQLLCLPLRLEGSDGVPARAILVSD
jgi:arylformamidase